MFSSVVIIDYGIKAQLDSAKPILTKYIKVYEKYSTVDLVDGCFRELGRVHECLSW